MRSNQTCFLYLIAHKGDDGSYQAPVKIGITHSISTRVKGLQTGNPNPIGLVFAFATPDKDFARQFERALHSVNAQMRLSGEWFTMEPRAALLDMVAAFWGILEHELGAGTQLWDDAMVACGAVGAMRLLNQHDRGIPH